MMYSADNLKADLPPERYYSSYLGGSFGKPTGRGWHMWNGLCPFHADKRPGSLVVNKSTGAFKCFSCGEAGGDIIDFHMKANSMSFMQTLSHFRGASQCTR